ncbi:DNA (cytosine-5-)-methyltransferase 3-like isoform 1 [Anopheles sinensis]|uniref:DNA (Cytosine-5-)-methyltransferase 3-like isoform 1 n=1 Tax=Anopheles sinensis TaxID=74873 RepID=A0A084VJ61_ANOSI|nr:DNA (cytosine-5-)-methyltransferase 3-like isoform 1 [Anopheles sinensis]
MKSSSGHRARAGGAGGGHGSSENFSLPYLTQLFLPVSGKLLGCIYAVHIWKNMVRARTPSLFSAQESCLRCDSKTPKRAASSPSSGFGANETGRIS